MAHRGHLMGHNQNELLRGPGEERAERREETQVVVRQFNRETAASALLQESGSEELTTFSLTGGGLV